MKARDIIKEMLERPIAFHPILGRIGGGACAGLFLSQAYYWSQRTKAGDGWFYKTMDEWRAETCLTRSEQETSRRELRDRGLLIEEKRGNPMKLWFRVDADAVTRAIADLAGNQHAGNQQAGNQQDEKRQPQLAGKQQPHLAGFQQDIKGTETTRDYTEITSSAGAAASVSSRFMGHWNQNCGGLPKIHEVTGKRRDKLRARTKNPKFEQAFIDAIKRASKTNFLLGDNNSGWKASFDWMIANDTNYLSVLEGKYDGVAVRDRKRPSDVAFIGAPQGVSECWGPGCTKQVAIAHLVAKHFCSTTCNERWLADGGHKTFYTELDSVHL